MLIIVVLIRWGWYNKISQTKWLLDNRNSFLTVLEAGRPRSRRQHGQVLLPGYSLLTFPVSSHDGRGEGALWSFGIRALIPQKDSAFVT